MYTLFNVLDNKVIAELSSDAAMINTVRGIAVENEDFDFSILSRSEAMEYIKNYCENLVLLSDVEINNFLTEFGIKVQENEAAHYVELMMDDHKCIEFKGTQYYISESLSYNVCTSDEEKIYDTLVYCCHV